MTLVLPGDGRTSVAGGNQSTFKIGPEADARDLSVFVSRVPPRGGVFPHLHRHYEEAFYVVDGDISFLIGTVWADGPAGTVVHIPRGTVHAFQNRSGAPAELLVMHTPAVAIKMIEELAALEPTASRAAVAAILGRHASEPAPAASD